MVLSYSFGGGKGSIVAQRIYQMKTISQRIPFSILLTVLAACSSVGAYDAWRAFSVFEFALGCSAPHSVGWVWFYAGPMLFFPASFLGLILGLFTASPRYRLRLGLNHVQLTWLPVSALVGGAVVFEVVDLFYSSHACSDPRLLRNAFLITIPMIVSGVDLSLIAIKGIGLLQAEQIIQSVYVNRTASVRWKRTARALGRGIGSLAILSGSAMAVAASCLLLFIASCTPPSLEALAGRFPAQRDDLETLVRMSNQDRQLWVIDPTWMETGPTSSTSDGIGHSVTSVGSGKDYDGYSPELGISRDRYEMYMKIFCRDAITQGLRRWGGGDIFFIVKSEGILDSGYSNGFVFCVAKEANPESQLQPCKSAPMQEAAGTGGDKEAYRFRKLSDHWYVFSQGRD